MRGNTIRLIFQLLLVLTLTTNSQDLESILQMKKDMSGFTKSGLQSSPKTIPVFQEPMVDIDRYKVAGGDVFWAKVDIPGPDYFTFIIPVSNTGFAVFSQIKSIYVKDKILRNALTKIKKHLKRNYADANIEVYFKESRKITVNVIQNGSRFFAVKLNAGVSLFEFANSILNNQLNGFSGSLNISTSLFSLRNIKIVRNGQIKNYDLYKYIYHNEESANPYLENGDKVFLDDTGRERTQILISGAVNRPGEYEYKPGDVLEDYINFARGFLDGVDSAHIAVIRFIDDKERTEKLILDYHEQSEFAIMPGDRIFIRSLPKFRQKYAVEVIGEVNYPGTYAILDGVTTLKEILLASGGITSKALLRDALLLRNKFLPKDNELMRLRKLTPSEMNMVERNYVKIRSRENIKIVVCDFEAIWNNQISPDDVVLRDGDQIIIPEKKGIIFVSGGVFNPGIIKFKKGWSYKDYIEAAGGFNKRAKKNKIKIIKAKTGVWLDADNNVALEEGDIIFTPEKEERDWWQMFREGLTVVTQVGTLAVIMLNLRKL